MDFTFTSPLAFKRIANVNKDSGLRYKSSASPEKGKASSSPAGAAEASADRMKSCVERMSAKSYLEDIPNFSPSEFFKSPGPAEMLKKDNSTSNLSDQNQAFNRWVEATKQMTLSPVATPSALPCLLDPTTSSALHPPSASLSLSLGDLSPASLAMGLYATNTDPHPLTLSSSPAPTLMSLDTPLTSGLILGSKVREDDGSDISTEWSMAYSDISAAVGKMQLRERQQQSEFIASQQDSYQDQHQHFGGLPIPEMSESVALARQPMDLNETSQLPTRNLQLPSNVDASPLLSTAVQLPHMVPDAWQYQSLNQQQDVWAESMLHSPMQEVLDLMTSPLSALVDTEEEGMSQDDHERLLEDEGIRPLQLHFEGVHRDKRAVLMAGGVTPQHGLTFTGHVLAEAAEVAYGSDDEVSLYDLAMLSPGAGMAIEDAYWRTASTSLCSSPLAGMLSLMSPSQAL
ncbi:hypothetical protein CEUSTIGMA_g3519.t1 [Chlamydomonas eustigma]|uniref:Uncharacterized protein n=1 Tax=Chlamydomonas eustigma TaxID=1157962 RepID=A0A250WZ67_9CHLO|nr:hypothetical protein CEUSTIGMA_g3519.t1 [Chlamydomonas eustigma]|eukprot:GAX76076.1 hypothetical protein CEUSTIGMA_g3519.t1 [Chlamydomonas eustigma]